MKINDRVYYHYFSQGLADNTVVAKVNGDVWDLDRPFEQDSSLQLLKFDDPDGKLELCTFSIKVLWHLYKFISLCSRMEISLLVFDQL